MQTKSKSTVQQEAVKQLLTASEEALAALMDWFNDELGFLNDIGQVEYLDQVITKLDDAIEAVEELQPGAVKRTDEYLAEKEQGRREFQKILKSLRANSMETRRTGSMPESATR